MFFVSPYFDHDAFMHHTMHVLDASGPKQPYAISRALARAEISSETFPWQMAANDLSGRYYRRRQTNSIRTCQVSDSLKCRMSCDRQKRLIVLQRREDRQTNKQTYGDTRTGRHELAQRGRVTETWMALNKYVHICRNRDR